MITTNIKLALRKIEDLALRAGAAVGMSESEARIARRARDLWRDPNTKNLASHSHAFGGEGEDGISERAWIGIGSDAVDRFDAAVRALGWDGPLEIMLDYGCGHGAQASAFAERVRKVIGVDVQRAALDIAAEHMRGVNDPPDYECTFVPVLVDEPEGMRDEIKPDYVDAFVSFYVFELIPGQRYGERILRVAYDLLRPGGIGFVQFKYPTGRLNATRRRGYNTRNLADTTKYRPDEFWAMVERVGFEPGHITIVERDELDEHYGYMSFTKPEGTSWPT